MKIIDLLNKIANGEELPKYIKYYDKLHSKEDTMLCCYTNLIYKLDNVMIDLNDEVEILEDEEKELPEKLHHCCMESENEEIKFLIQNINDLADKYNDLLDYLEKQRKGNED